MSSKKTTLPLCCMYGEQSLHMHKAYKYATASSNQLHGTSRLQWLHAPIQQLPDLSLFTAFQTMPQVHRITDWYIVLWKRSPSRATADCTSQPAFHSFPDSSVHSSGSSVFHLIVSIGHNLFLTEHFCSSTSQQTLCVPKSSVFTTWDCSVPPCAHWDRNPCVSSVSALREFVIVLLEQSRNFNDIHTVRQHDCTEASWFSISCSVQLSLFRVTKLCRRWGYLMQGICNAACILPSEVVEMMYKP